MRSKREVKGKEVNRDVLVLFFKKKKGRKEEFVFEHLFRRLFTVTYLRLSSRDKSKLKFEKEKKREEKGKMKARRVKMRMGIRTKSKIETPEGETLKEI